GGIYPRLVAASSPGCAALGLGATGRVSERLAGALPGTGVTDRAVREPALAGPHAAAPAAHDGGAAAALAGGAVFSAAPRPAAADTRCLARPFPACAVGSPGVPMAHASRAGLVPVRRRDLVLACA